MIQQKYQIGIYIPKILYVVLDMDYFKTRQYIFTDFSIFIELITKIFKT